MIQPTPSRRPPPRWLVFCLLAALGSCKLLADEFVWLDRAAPIAADADPAGGAARARP